MSTGGADRAHDPVGRWLRDLARAAQWHRRLLSAALLAAAAALGLHAAAPPPAPSVAVLAAARDLPAGERLTPDAVRQVRSDPTSLPDGVLTELAEVRDAVVALPVRRGELLTDVRLVGPGLVAALGRGLVAAPVRLGDGEAASLLRPGDTVDVLAAGAAEAGSTARLVASAVRVLSVAKPREVLGRATDNGGLVILATSELTAARLAGAAVTDRLSVVLRPG